MEKGFSLDPVQINDTRVPIDQTVTLPIPILTHPAKTSLPIGNTTPSGAKFTLDFSTFQYSEIGGEFCLDKTLFRSLRLRGFRKTEKVSGIEGTKTLSAKL